MSRLFCVCRNCGIIFREAFLEVCPMCKQPTVEEHLQIVSKANCALPLFLGNSVRKKK
jgi:hypothetical protein